MACLGCSESLFGYEHTGGMHPKAQIEFVKQQIKLKKEPYLASFNQLLLMADSALLMNHHAIADLNVPGYYKKPLEHRKNSLAIQADGFVAYSCALAWQLTKKKKYAEKALYILNAWSSINKGYSDFDGPLVLSYSATSLIIAAELMLPYKKWKQANKTAFAGWVKNVYIKATKELRNKKNNWADWGRYGGVLAAYYLDDEMAMKENIALIKSDLFDKIATDGHMIEEVKREKNGIWYTYFSLAPITASCWVIHNATGENIFNQSKEGKSLKSAIDYLLYYNEHPSEWKWYKDPAVGSADSQIGFWPVNLLAAMNGVYHDSKYVNFVKPHQPIIYNKHHFAWTFPTLMPVSMNGY